MIFTGSGSHLQCSSHRGQRSKPPRASRWRFGKSVTSSVRVPRVRGTRPIRQREAVNRAVQGDDNDHYHTVAKPAKGGPPWSVACRIRATDLDGSRHIGEKVRRWAVGHQRSR